MLDFVMEHGLDQARAHYHAIEDVFIVSSFKEKICVICGKSNLVNSSGLVIDLNRPIDERFNHRPASFGYYRTGTGTVGPFCPCCDRSIHTELGTQGDI